MRLFVFSFEKRKHSDGKAEQSEMLSWKRIKISIALSLISLSTVDGGRLHRPSVFRTSLL